MNMLVANVRRPFIERLTSGLTNAANRLGEWVAFIAWPKGGSCHFHGHRGKYVSAKT